MTTSTDIVNQAIQLIGDNQPLVTGVAPNFDSSPAGIAASELYSPCVATIGRQWAWDLARNTQPLTTTGNSPPEGWTAEYIYPQDGIEVWQVMPGTIADPNNPLPVNWNVGNDIVNGVQEKVILTNFDGAVAVYNNMPNENTWDPLFREAVVRLLASEIAIALAGRPDTAQALIESGAAFEEIGQGRPD